MLFAQTHIQDFVVVRSASTRVALIRLRDIEWIAERSIVNGVLKTFNRLSAEKVIQRTVLHFEYQNILDLLLHVVN